MSKTAASQPAASQQVTVEECARWRRRARDGDGTREIAATTGYVRSTIGKHVRNSDETCSHTTAAEAGVAPLTGRDPGAVSVCDEQIETVCAVLEARLTRNYGTTIYANPATLSSAVALSGRHIGAVLVALADQPHCGLAADRVNPDSNRRQWAVRRVGGGE